MEYTQKVIICYENGTPKLNSPRVYWSRVDITLYRLIDDFPMEDGHLPLPCVITGGYSARRAGTVTSGLSDQPSDEKTKTLFPPRGYMNSPLSSTFIPLSTCEYQGNFIIYNDCLETWQQEQFPCPVSNSESQNLGIWLRQISPNLIALSSTISACEKGGEWQMALELFASAHMAPWKNGQFNIFQHSALLQLELFY